MHRLFEESEDNYAISPVPERVVLFWIVHVGLALIPTPLMLGHIYVALINPSTRVGLSGMLSGCVDRHWAEHHYRRWYRENFEKDPGEDKEAFDQCRQNAILVLRFVTTRRFGNNRPTAISIQAVPAEPIPIGGCEGGRGLLIDKHQVEAGLADCLLHLDSDRLHCIFIRLPQLRTKLPPQADTQCTRDGPRFLRRSDSRRATVLPATCFQRPRLAGTGGRRTVSPPRSGDTSKHG